MSVPRSFLISHTALSQASNAAAIRDRRGRRKEIFARSPLLFLSSLSLAARLKTPLCSHVHAARREPSPSPLPPHCQMIYTHQSGTGGGGREGYQAPIFLCSVGETAFWEQDVDLRSGNGSSRRDEASTRQPSATRRGGGRRRDPGQYPHSLFSLSKNETDVSRRKEGRKKGG